VTELVWPANSGTFYPRQRLYRHLGTTSDQGTVSGESPSTILVRCGGISCHSGVGMTLRLPDELDIELRAAAEEDHRSLHQTVILAVEIFLALRETSEIKADPEALRALADARESVRDGDVVYGVDAARDLLKRRGD
jgi:hypothetical protein